MQEVTSIHFLGINVDSKQEEFIKQVIKTCFKEEKLENLNLYVSITLTTPNEIRKLNKEYRQIDKETDVLSFPMFEKEEIDNMVNENEPNEVTEVLGDIVISIDRVKEQAKEYGHSFERELSYMLVHGFYHLMGYDHIQESDKIIMRPKEEKVLEQLKQTR